MMWLGSGCSDGSAKEAARPVGECDPGRSQSPHSTAAVKVARGTASKTGPREVGQEGGCAMTGSEQESAGSAAKATQGAEAARDFSWVDALVWTERMSC